MKSIKSLIICLLQVMLLPSSLLSVDGFTFKGHYVGSQLTSDLPPPVIQEDTLLFPQKELSNPLLEYAQESLTRSKTSPKSSDSVFSVGHNFTAMTASNAAITFFSAPLNLTGAVGEEQYILCTYQSIRSFNKKTGKPDGVLNTSGFGFVDTGDILINYDRFAKRWYVCVRTMGKWGPTKIS